MANYEFTAYEDALLALLEPMRAPMGKLMELKGFNGEVMPVESNLVVVLLNRFPAVLVEISGADYEAGPGDGYTEKSQAVIYVCANTLRDQGDERTGEFGCYPLLREILNRLTGKKIKEDIHPLFPKRVERLVGGQVMDSNEHVLVYRMTFDFSNPLCRLEVLL